MIAAVASSAIPLPIAYSATVLGASPLRYWKHNDAVSSAVLLDSSTTGDTTCGTTTGLRGQLAKPSLLNSDAGTCADYLGSASYYANSTNQTGLNVPTITVEAWVQPDATSGILVCRDGGAGAVQYRLWLNAGKLEFRFWTVAGGSGTAFDCVGATTITANGTNKFYCVGTYDGTNAKVYLNGTQDGVLNQSGVLRTPSSVGTYLGIHGSGTNFLNGRMGHAAVYSGAATSGQVADRWAAAA